MEKNIICLDTSILIKYFRKTRKEKTVLFRLTQKYSRFAVSIITKFEIYSGCNDKQKEFWDNLFSQFKILAFDNRCNNVAIDIYKQLKRKNKLIEMPDILIASTAVAYNLKLSTLNEKHFNRIDALELEN